MIAKVRCSWRLWVLAFVQNFKFEQLGTFRNPQFMSTVEKKNQKEQNTIKYIYILIIDCHTKKERMNFIRKTKHC